MLYKKCYEYNLKIKRINFKVVWWISSDVDLYDQHHTPDIE